MLFHFVESTVKGTLNPDGTLQLDEQPIKMQPGPVEVVIRQRSGNVRDWWNALKEIIADQRQRGFAGAATNIDRSDEGYDERLREISRNTLRDDTNG
jgi:hypothetical protein